MLKRIARKMLQNAERFRICIKEFLSGGSQTMEYEALVVAHSIEKGLGLRDTQPGHSVKQALLLIDLLDSFSNTDCYAYIEAYQILTIYINYQKKYYNGLPSAELETVMKRYESLKKGSSIQYQAGSVTLTKDELESGQDFNFKGFISSRHTIRTFRPEKVPISEILNAIELANKAPSACNRQPQQVYFCNNKEIVGEIDSIITGSNGFKGEINNYAFITEDRDAFKGEEEFQWYINGGIYAGFFLLALHSLGIGSCIMQWKEFNKSEKQVKSLLGIPDREAIIVVIGLGYYQDETKCLCAQRKASKDILHVIN